jgi:HEPN domain-containing protein
VNRTEWQQLAEERILDAQTLLAAHRWSIAYYVAGYAVECGLKACILVHLAANPELIFVEKHKRYSIECWTHDLEDLLELADLTAQRNSARTANPALGAKWLTVKDWKETSRYERKSQVQALEL